MKIDKKISFIFIIFSILFVLIMLSACAKKITITGDLDHLKDFNFKIEKDNNGKQFAKVNEGTNIIFAVDQEKIRENLKTKFLIKSKYIIKNLKTGNDKEVTFENNSADKITIPGQSVTGDIIISFQYEDLKYVGFKSEDPLFLNCFEIIYDETKFGKEAKNEDKLKNKLYREGLISKIKIKEGIFRDKKIKSIYLNNKEYKDGDEFIFPKRENSEQPLPEKINVEIPNTSFEDLPYFKIEKYDELKNHGINISLKEKDDNFRENEFYQNDTLIFDFKNQVRERDKFISGLTNEINNEDILIKENKIELKLTSTLIKDKQIKLGIKKAQKAEIIVLFDGKKYEDLTDAERNLIIKNHVGFDNNLVSDNKFYEDDKFDIELREIKVHERARSIVKNEIEILEPINGSKFEKKQSLKKTIKVKNEKIEFKTLIENLTKVKVSVSKNISYQILNDTQINTTANGILEFYPYQILLFKANLNPFKTNPGEENQIDYTKIFNFIKLNETIYYLNEFQYKLKENEDINLISEYFEVSEKLKFELENKANKKADILINGFKPRTYYKKGEKLLFSLSSDIYKILKIKINTNEIKVDSLTYEKEIDQNFEVVIENDYLKQIKTNFIFDNYYENSDDYDKVIKIPNEISTDNLNKISIKNQFIVFEIKNENQNINYLEFNKIYFYDQNGEEITDENVLNKLKIKFLDNKQKVRFQINDFFAENISQVKINQNSILIISKLIIEFDKKLIPNYLIENTEGYIFSENKFTYSKNFNKNYSIKLTTKENFFFRSYTLNNEKKFINDLKELEIILTNNTILKFEKDDIIKKHSAVSLNLDVAKKHNLVELFFSVSGFEKENYENIIFDFLDEHKKYLSETEPGSNLYYFKDIPETTLKINLAAKNNKTNEIENFEVIINVIANVNSYTLNNQVNNDFTIDAGKNVKDKSKRKLTYEVGAKNYFNILNNCSIFIYDNELETKTKRDFYNLTNFSSIINYQTIEISEINENGKRIKKLSIGIDFVIINGFLIDFSNLASSKKQKGLDETLIEIKFNFNFENQNQINSFKCKIINDGLNVYTQNEIENNISKDENIYLILHNNLKLKVRPDQLNKDKRHPDFNSSSDKKIKEILGKYSNNIAINEHLEGSFFLRKPTNHDFIFSGNCFVLDASNAPHCIIENSWSSWLIADPSNGLFFFDLNPDNNADNVIKNVKMLGNSSYPKNYGPGSENVPIWESAGMNGVRSLGGKITIENCNMLNFVNGFYTRYTEAKLINSKLENSFNCNVVYSNSSIYNFNNYDCQYINKIYLENNFIGLSGGASVNIIDYNEYRRGSFTGGLVIPDGEEKANADGIGVNDYKYEISNKKDGVDNTIGIYDMLEDYEEFKQSLNQKQREKFIQSEIFKDDNMFLEKGVNDDNYRAHMKTDSYIKARNRYIRSYNLDPSIYLKYNIIENLNDGKGQYFKSFGFDADVVIAQIAKELFGAIFENVDDNNQTFAKSHTNLSKEINLAILLQNPVIGIKKTADNDIHYRQAHDVYFFGQRPFPTKYDETDSLKTDWTVINRNIWNRSYRGAQHRYGFGEGKHVSILENFARSQAAVLSVPGYSLIQSFNNLQNEKNDPQSQFKDDAIIAQLTPAMMAMPIYSCLSGKNVVFNRNKVSAITKSIGLPDASSPLISQALTGTFNKLLNHRYPKGNNSMQFETDEFRKSFIELMPLEFDLGGSKIPIAGTIYLGVFDNEIPNDFFN